MRESVIEVEHLNKSFGSFQAVRDLSFSVYRGDVFGFLGPNGAGKSTTIRCMLSLIKADSGSVSMFGKSFKENRNWILSRCGSIIERPDFYKYLSAERNLQLFARLSGTNSSSKEIYAMLDFVGLNGREKDKVGGFSQGMKQRLGIAQTLLHNPDLIILDEPTNGLDPQGIIDIRNLILQLKHEQKKTILLSSHQLSEIELIANRMVIINKGRAVVEGEVANLLNSDELMVRLEVNSVEHACALVRQHFASLTIESVDDKHLNVVLQKDQVPKLNTCFVENDVQVFAIESKRKLEDYFISIVNQ